MKAGLPLCWLHATKSGFLSSRSLLFLTVCMLGDFAFCCGLISFDKINFFNIFAQNVNHLGLIYNLGPEYLQRLSADADRVKE